MPKPPKPSPVNDAIDEMTSGEPVAKKPKGAPRGHPFKKGGKHKHGGVPFPKRTY